MSRRGFGIRPLDYAVGGGVAALALPEFMLADQNTGTTGVILNAGFGLALGLLVGRFNRKARGPIIAGGIAAAGIRYLNQNYLGDVQFPGLSGPGAATMGKYVDARFPLPTTPLNGWRT